ncbi:MAG: AAA family ATPase [Candidatus Saccharimonadales bacterium]
MNEIKVVALVGMPGAGKSFCIDHMMDQGIPSVYFGGVTIDEVKARGLEINEQNERLVREDIRAKEGAGAYAERMINKIDILATEGHQKIVADGLYSWTEYKIFKEHYGDNVLIVAIASPRSMRHERLSQRKLRPLTESAVSKREYAEIENLEKGGPIANADYTIVNDVTPGAMLNKLDAIVSSFWS